MHYDAPVSLLKKMQADSAASNQRFLKWFEAQPQPMTIYEICQASGVEAFRVIAIVEELCSLDIMTYSIVEGFSRYYTE